MTEMKAKPAELANFKSTGDTAVTNLTNAQTTYGATVRSFLNTGNSGVSGGYALVGSTITELLGELGEIKDWVELIRVSVLAADAEVHDGTRTVDVNTLNVALKKEAAARGLDVADLVQSNVVTPPVLSVTAVPQDSGFVNDPVCTATGHLLIDAHDFEMPPRLDLLRFRRLYASQDLVDGAFGAGWWSWADARGAVGADGSFVLVGPDARHITLPADGHGGFTAPAALDLHATAVGARQQLRWGRRSAYYGQTWEFEAGALRSVTSPFLGVTEFTHDAGGRLVAMTHDSGRSLSLVWRGRTVTAIETDDGRRSTFRYDRRGHLVGVVNAVSPETYEVDEVGRVLSITDADDVRLVAMTYDPDGRVVAQISETGLMTRFAYGRVRRTTLSDGDHSPISVYTHDEQGRVEMYATAGGLRFSRRFDEFGRVAAQQDPDGLSMTLTERWDGAQRIERFEWSNGRAEEFAFDVADRLVHHTDNTGGTTPAGVRFSYHADSPLPRRVEVDGELGIAVDVTWEHAVPARIVDSDGVTDTYAVNPDGTIASYRNGVGATIAYEWHPSGAVAARDLADGRRIEYERDQAGRLLAVINALGERAELQYTAAGRLESAVDYDGAVNSIAYDSAGRPDHTTGADGAETAFVVDDEQRITGVVFPNGDAIGLELDEFGREVAVDVNGRRWTTERDAGGRVTKRTAPDGDMAEVDHDPLGQWTSITDAAGERWQFERGLADRVRRLATPTGVYEAEFTAEGLLAADSAPGAARDIRYTSAGRIASIAQGGQWIELRYDAAGRIAGVNGGTGWWRFDYDGDGRIVRRISPAGREQGYRYDLRGHLAAIDVGGATWGFRHDSGGRLVALVDPTGRTAEFSYDVAGRMVVSNDPAGVALHYDYDQRGRIAALRDGDGGTLTYEFDGLNQLTALTDQVGRSIVAAHDAAGRYTGTTYVDRRDTRPTAASLDDLGIELPTVPATALAGGRGVRGRSESPDGLVTTWELASGAVVELERDADGFAQRLTSPGFCRGYARDQCGRVVRVVDEIEGVTRVTELRRDAAGRVVRQAVDGVVTEYEYGPAGELTSRSGPDGVHEWEYDRLGRLGVERSPSGERRFRYDAAHQLVELVEAAVDGTEARTTTFEYDGRGRRIRARGARDIVYVWGEQQLDALVIDGVARPYRSDGAGRLTVAGGVALAWDDDAFASLRPAAIGDEALITIDATTAATVADDGTVSWRPFTVADAWGGRGDARAVRWHECYGVAADGVVWLGARPYDPDTRQFLAPDPLAPTPGRAGGASPYTYAANDPINLFDPSGNAPVSIEAYEDARDRMTGMQWQNVATVAIAVVAVVATVATAGAAGPLATVAIGMAIGASAGAASGLARESIEANMNVGDGTFNGEAIIKDAVLGAAGGAFGAGVGVGISAATRAAGPTLAAAISSRSGSIISEGLSGAGEGIMGEAYDVTMPKGWGADGSWDNGDIVVNTVVSAGAGGALHNVGAPGSHGSSSTGGVDPATISIDSPAPGRVEVTTTSTSASAATSVHAPEVSVDLPSPASTAGSSQGGADAATHVSSPSGVGDAPSTASAGSSHTASTHVDAAGGTSAAPASSGPASSGSHTDATPAAQSDTTPAAHADTTPAAQTDTTPAAHTDTTAPHTDTTPAAHADTTPAAQTDTTPAAQTDTTPAAQTDTTPAAHTDTTPAAHTDTTPAAQTDTTPAAHADTTPAAHTDTTPAAQTDTTPAAQTDTTPAAQTDTTPAAHADTTPAAHADTTPAAQTDTTPAAHTDTTPAGAADPGPAPHAAAGTPDASPTAPHAAAGTPDATPTAPHAAAETPDATPTAPHAAAGTPDASPAAPHNPAGAADSAPTSPHATADPGVDSHAPTTAADPTPAHVGAADSAPGVDGPVAPHSDTTPSAADVTTTAAAAAAVASPTAPTAPHVAGGPAGGHPSSASAPVAAADTPSSTTASSTPGRPVPHGGGTTDYVTVRPVSADGVPGRPTTVRVDELTTAAPTGSHPASGDVATLPDGSTVQVGGNRVSITHDARGFPVRAHMDVTERYPGLNRTTAELDAQRAAAADGRAASAAGQAAQQDWDGGHLGGHQFFPDLGRANMFPQEMHLNRWEGYRRFEQDIERHVSPSGATDGRTPGFHAEADVELWVDGPTGSVFPQTAASGDLAGLQQAPDRVVINVVLHHPDAMPGRIPEWRAYSFNNAPQASQSPAAQAYRPSRPAEARSLEAEILAEAVGAGVP